MKRKFTSEDLNQISYKSLEERNKSELIDLTIRLRNFTIDLYERLNQDSTNSSRPPSSDSPFGKNNDPKTKDNVTQATDTDDADTDENNIDDSEHSGDNTQNTSDNDQTDKSEGEQKENKRKPGKQPGSQGFGRCGSPVSYRTEQHYPEQCIICNSQLDNNEAVLHTGFYTYELEKSSDSSVHSIKIVCVLHHYYSQVCSCGHKNVDYPGSGYESVIEGRACNITLSEYTLVGPMLAAFIASLNRDYGMSRNKIRDYLQTWFNFELSIGLICKTIRETGIACYPVVDELIEQLQEENLVHLDETAWKEKGILLWVWVGITANLAVYLIGSRKKEMLLQLITEVFMGWIITDGYGVYRGYEKRQRCLAHLIRKAVALTGAVDEKASLVQNRVTHKR
jgi:transposase